MNLQASFSNYPGKYYAEQLANEEIIRKKFGNKTPLFDELKESTLKLNINYEKLEYTLIREDQKTTLIDLISNVGGTLGLCLGMSFLSIVEIAEIGMEIVLSLLKKNKKLSSKN